MNTPNEPIIPSHSERVTLSASTKSPLGRPPAIPGQSYLKQSFATDYEAIPGELTARSLLERLLKAPASVVYELTCGRRSKASLLLAAIATLCFLGYGFIIGTFSAGEQLLIVPVKLLGGVIFSAVICLPSLYIFSCFSGGASHLEIRSGYSSWG